MFIVRHSQLLLPASVHRLSLPEIGSKPVKKNVAAILAHGKNSKSETSHSCPTPTLQHDLKIMLIGPIIPEG